MKYITQTELAAKLGISLSHLKYYIKKGAIRTSVRYGRILCESEAKIEIRNNVAKINL
jgi:predicted site-specific integrase-resolvase